MVMLSMSPEVGPPPPALTQTMAEAMREAFASGLMIDAGGLMPMADSTQFTLRGGALERIDGPYAEAKEVVGGYAVLDVRSHEEAVEGARRMMVIHQQHWPGWEGSAQVRRIGEPEEGPPAV
jgi:hypothetical protein